MRLFKVLLFLFIPNTPVLAASPVLVIAHRGASGLRPEHTLASYNLAIDQGADFIEPDLVISKDGMLIVRHENNIAETTDVAQIFPERKATKIIDGETITGFFTEDFTLKELKTLRAKERLPFRNQGYNGQNEILTFGEVLDLAAARNVGVYPETKHPSYFRSIGLPLEPRLIQELQTRGLTSYHSPVIIQSFELSSLYELSQSLFVRLIFLMEDAGLSPYDHVLLGDPRTYGDMMTPSALKQISTFLYGIGPNKRSIVPEAQGHLGPATKLIYDAHANGLKVHPYAFRSDKEFLHADYGGDPQNEYLQFIRLGVDGFFSDFPDHAVKAVKSCNGLL